jgi:hypothetical protein
LAVATATDPYSQKLEASGGVAPLKWTVDPPNLPAGVTLNAITGTIEGTPGEALGKMTFKFTVTDSATTPASDSAELMFEIKGKTSAATQ